MTEMSDRGAAPMEERGWDPLLRGFHWLLAIFVTLAWCLAEFGPARMILHFWSGYAVVALLLFRLVWGFAGPREARFRSFLKGPSAVIAYAKTLPERKPGYTGAGHNPLGGWMVALMLIALTVQVVTGLTLDPEDYINAGPLSGFVPEGWRRFALSLHHATGALILFLVILHVSAIVFYRVWKHEDLVTPMLHGRRRG